MASAARLLIRDGKSAARLVFRERSANLTKRLAIRSQRRAKLTNVTLTNLTNVTPQATRFLVMQSGFGRGPVVQQERLGKMEATHGKKVVDDEASDSEEEDESDFDDDDFDDDFLDEDDDEDDGSEEEEKFTKKK